MYFKHEALSQVAIRLSALVTWDALYGTSWEGLGLDNKCVNEEDEVTFNPLFFQKGLFGGKLGIVTAFLPWIYASFVACSRLVDNWHHPSDIVAGSLIGIFCSTLAYHLW